MNKSLLYQRNCCLRKMNSVIFVCLLILCGSCVVLGTNDVAKHRWKPRTFNCSTDAYPNPNNTLPSYTVDLSLPPQERWVKIAALYKNELHNLVGIVRTIFGKYAPEVLQFIDKEFATLLDRYPQEYAQEMVGIAEGGDLDIGFVVMYNMFYELFTFCTSVVAQDDNGNLYHGRNLDFGLLPAYNLSSDPKDWTLTQLLRPLTVSVDFVQNGKLLFKSVQFVGYIGILSGMRIDGYAVTVDDRFDNSFDAGLIDWMRNPSDNAQFFGLMLRDMFATVDNYNDALPILQNTQIISPIYFIVSGSESGEGVVISREKNVTLSTATLQEQLNAGTFYLAETNYDQYYNNPSGQPVGPWFDQRQYAVMQCLNQTGQLNIDWSTLYNVLYTKPIRNQLTTYTILMSAQVDYWQVWHQYCEPPCALW